MKLSEGSATAVPREIQGEEVDGQFSYDKAHIAALVPDKPDLGQNVYILHTESPQQIFVCPENQIGLAEKLAEQCETYANIDKDMVGHSPSKGKLCLAKSKDDDSWYRAACIDINGDEYEMFFVDFGFMESLPRIRMKAIHPKLMETVFLANPVCLEGFEDMTKSKEYKDDFGEEIAKLLEPFSMTKIKVVKQNQEEGFYIGRFKELKHMKPKLKSDVPALGQPVSSDKEGHDKKQTSSEVDTKASRESTVAINGHVSEESKAIKSDVPAKKPTSSEADTSKLERKEISAKSKQGFLSYWLDDFDDAKRQVQVGDKVVFIDFMQSASKMSVMLKKHEHFEEPLMEVMLEEFSKQDSISIKEIEMNQVVACQWSEEDMPYRAVVKKVMIEEKKVMVRFLDYGNTTTESIENIRRLPETAANFPLLAKLVVLDDVPEASIKDVKIENKLKQLSPILNDFEVVGERSKKLVLKHPNGGTVNEIIKAKLAEGSATAVPREIQGEEVDGQFSYDKAHIAALVPDKPDLGQNVYILHTESPQQIFVCPENQIGLAEKLAEQCETYANIDKDMVGHSPSKGKLCLAKSKDDDSWYRAACIDINGDEYEMFFVDFGFMESLPRIRMKA